MRIHISPSSGLPIYLQIINQIKYLAASGRLMPGEELPSIRVLAEQLVVNPNTVARAYRELETAGIVRKQRATGTYISGAGSPLTRAEQRRIVTERVDMLLAEARQVDFSLEEVVELLRERDREMGSPLDKQMEGESVP